MKTVYLILFSMLLSSCDDDCVVIQTHSYYTRNAGLFANIIDGNIKGDPYTIYSVNRTATSLEVKVGYSGGCANHDFKLVWKGAYDTFKQRHITSLALLHDANMDGCEAYIIETLRFNLQEVFHDESMTSNYDLLFYHGYNKEEYFMAEETMNITQGIECNLNASFEEVICGSGFFDNKWFRSTDSDLISGHDTFYFQPVEYDLDDTPNLGSYQLSVRILKEYVPDPDDIICQAYPGYSIPVKITCLDAIE